MNPDGSINTVLWDDFARRGIHQMAVKTKQITKAYYGKPAKYSYWDGFSTGGRQGHKLAQVHPNDFDGILAGAPAFNWTRFITNELYPQIVFQRDLGGVPMTAGQLNLLGNAAINACDVVNGQHIGYIPDPSECRYDPTHDAAVICAANGGTNTTADCVTPPQAKAMNKLWYGQTRDGMAPPPSVDNSWSLNVGRGNHLWYGLARGSSFGGLAGSNAGVPAPFTIATDLVALELQNPMLATPSFINATGNGANGWTNLSYAQLANAYDQGLILQSNFAHINTDDANLRPFRKSGGKMIMYHGLADVLIMPQGSVNYYERVIREMDGLREVQKFYRFFLVPGMAHGFSNGTTNPNANPPLPGAAGATGSGRHIAALRRAHRLGRERHRPAANRHLLRRDDRFPGRQDAAHLRLSQGSKVCRRRHRRCFELHLRRLRTAPNGGPSSARRSTRGLGNRPTASGCGNLNGTAGDAEPTRTARRGKGGRETGTHSVPNDRLRWPSPSRQTRFGVDGPIARGSHPGNASCRNLGCRCARNAATDVVQTHSMGEQRWPQEHDLPLVRRRR